MYKIYIILLIIGFQSKNYCFGQNNPLIINAVVTENSVSITFYPTDPSIWKEGMMTGYSISRELKNAENNSARRFTPVKVIVKDSLWFKNNVTQYDGVISPIGQILNGSDFLKEKDKQNLEIQYNYIVYESTLNIKVAEAVGLGYVDNSIVLDATYIYTIKHNKSGLSASIEVKCTNGARYKEPIDYEPSFEFPDGNSLSDMYYMSKPFVLQAVIGKARPLMDSVILRWAPTTTEIMRNAMVDGYDVYRMNDSTEMIKIATVMPWSEDRFQDIPLTDSLALLAASMVKNKGIPPGLEMLDMYEQSSLQSNYFGFALHAADRSSLASEVLGLRYVDKDVKLGEIYSYRIETKRLEPNLPVPNILVVNEYEPLLAPEGFKIIKNDKQVTLQWLANSNLTKYNSYIIERQNPQDSVFQLLTPSPLVFIQQSGQELSHFSYVDKLDHNNISYHYRIRGSNAFGEWSDYAYGIGFGIDKTPPAPVSIISGLYQPDSSRLRISWTLPDDLGDLKYHQVLLSEDPKYDFSAVSAELPPSDTMYYFSLENMNSDRPFYFIVMSFDSSGNEATSIVKFVTVPDYERPDPPTNLKATIDSTGVVTAIWTPSPSHDVTGYYIYYSNREGKELTMINDYLSRDTMYTWTLPLNTTTKFLYVGVKAEDDNYNKSFITDVVKIRRPDTIPPVRPFIYMTEYEDEQVVLRWKKSSSNDVEKYIVYRRNSLDSIGHWIPLDTLTSEVLEYMDATALIGGMVQYAVKAVDDFNNESEYSKESQISISFPENKFIPTIINLTENNSKSVTLTWSNETQAVPGYDGNYTYQVFRSIGAGEVAIYQEIPKDEFSLVDSKTESGILYNYAVRVKYENGWTGSLSAVKSILIQ